MDRCEKVNGQSTLLRPARPCDVCRRHPVYDGGRRSKATGHRMSRDCDYVNNDNLCASNFYRNHEVWPRKVQRIARKPESGNGDFSVLPCHRSSSSWKRRDEPGRTLLVHGLGRDMNCDNVFNMFCLYGNVTAVKILKNRQVLVELDDVKAAERCVSNLHLLPLDQKTKLKVKYSKYSYIHDKGTVAKLSDGTPAQKNYTPSILNRFSSKTNFMDKRRIAAPSKILHFFNAPMDICGLNIRRAVINALDCKDAVRSITILPQKQPDAKCSTGLLEMKSVDLAAKALLLLNHMKLESSRSRFPFLLKLCFSKWSEMRQKSGNSTALVFNTTPRTPWLFHRSDHGVSSAEFTISQITRATDDGYPWTLWDLRKRATETIVHEAVISTDTECGPSGQTGTLQDLQLVRAGRSVDT
ncbi:uncharacterized protein LOC112691912 [Sipha flava]|uniref:Uncharacterized protein LOC112691912 n=1 Tax=Sipha flava TaxID=143950 RepID=A0A8B8GHS1_9HEMI|nr:uncharacterized protein LOC112691912 [Sipha flava]